MNHADNPFTRALQKYQGVDVEMVDADSRQKQFPDCDIAMFANQVVNHELMWNAKAWCQKRSIPHLHSTSGFSPIKESFENFLQERGHAVVLKGNGAPLGTLGAALEQALNPKPQPQPIASKPVAKKFDKIAVNKLLRDAFEANMKSVDIVDLLIAEGHATKQNGKPWKVADVSARRAYLGFKSPDSTTAAPPTPRARRQATLTALEQMELITKVMAAKGLASQRKVELAEEIAAGLRTCENDVLPVVSPDRLQLVARNIFVNEDKVLLDLDVVTAIAVIAQIDAIKKFAAGGDHE